MMIILNIFKELTPIQNKFWRNITSICFLVLGFYNFILFVECIWWCGLSLVISIIGFQYIKRRYIKYEDKRREELINKIMGETPISIAQAIYDINMYTKSLGTILTNLEIDETLQIHQLQKENIKLLVETIKTKIIITEEKI